MAPPPDLRRPFKRPKISDQQKRRELSLQRQSQQRRDAQQQARCLAETILSFTQNDAVSEQSEQELFSFDLRDASKLKGSEARRWFAKQLMLPEWMIDVPDRLNPQDWFVFARPSGKRCFVVSSNNITVSRLRNGSMLHRFRSLLPSGGNCTSTTSSSSYCILDCVFHEPDQTYYVIDCLSWSGMSLYECTAEFRFFWLNSKLAEIGIGNGNGNEDKFRFSGVVVYNCDRDGLNAAYSGLVPYVKDGILFYNKHANYQAGNTPLVLVWKDENCSQYVVDTDSKGQVLDQQHVVLEMLDDGISVATSDDPPVVFGCLDGEFVQKMGLKGGYLVRFAIGGGGLCFGDGKLEKADLHYIGKSNRARAFADSYSKIIFQYMVRHSPLRIEHLFGSISSSTEDKEENTSTTPDIDMAG